MWKSYSSSVEIVKGVHPPMSGTGSPLYGAGRRAGGVRGRRPAGGHSREEIVTAARRQFGELGYRRASMRGIAAEAGVDPRLILHFFGSKQELFVALVDLPFDPGTTFEQVLTAGGGGRRAGPAGGGLGVVGKSGGGRAPPP